MLSDGSTSEEREITKGNKGFENRQNKDGARSGTYPTSVPNLNSSQIHIGEVVSLNVGGKIFWTSKSTLTKFRYTMLDSMFSGRHKVPNSAYVIFSRSANQR